MVVHAFNPRTLEVEADESLSSWPVWFIEKVPGQPGLHRETQINKNEGRKGRRKDGSKEEREGRNKEKE